MIEFGKTLREAREAKGYSVSQLAEVTHILPQIIESLEKEDFSKIVAPIYGRGFVKICCEHVGIDPKPLVDEFMEIYSGNRPPVIRLREVSPQETEPSPSPEPSAVESPSVVPEPPVTELEPSVDEPPPRIDDLLSQSLPSAEPVKAGADGFPFSEAEPTPRRDYRLPGCSIPDVPRKFWRFGLLVLALVVVLVLVVSGGRALYRATMAVPGTQTSARETVVPGEDGKGTPRNSGRQASDARTPRTGVRVPPLYID